MKVLITGNSGSGKSTLLPALEPYGFTVYNTDDVPNVCRLEDQQTGQPADWPDGFVDWTRYSWNWQPQPLRKLLDSSANVAIAAVMGNQRAFYDWFDLRFVLTVSDDALERHWQKSTDHHISAHPNNLTRALKRNKLKEQQFIDDGCIPIVGDRPVANIAADIVRIAHEHEKLAG